MLVKTHLIITEQSDEYEIKWKKRLLDTNPLLNEKGCPTFIIITADNRMEISTLNMRYLEEKAKKFTLNHGREAYTVDKGYIYVKEVENRQSLLGIVYRYHTKKFAPMFDDIPI